ncbi:MAG: CDP-alcohol phosphatidyltransferase family protein [Oscillospiraceae bacterium]|nr:CDP-alcohol phosphatidyltransferase family protein [Oscillospiraceae bacterium]
MTNIDWKKEIMTIPNLLSLFRLILIPVYVVIYLNATEEWHYYLSAGILAVSCITDLLDGQIARRFNMISNLGKLLDPIADKATQFALIICLAFRYPLMFLLIFLFVIKEGFQLIAMGMNLRKGKALDGALMSGKVCTTVLFVTLIFMVMLPGMQDLTANLMIWIDIIFLLIAFGDYVMAYYGKESKVTDLKLHTKEPKEPEE